MDSSRSYNRMIIKRSTTLGKNAPRSHYNKREGFEQNCHREIKQNPLGELGGFLAAATLLALEGESRGCPGGSLRPGLQTLAPVIAGILVKPQP